MLEHAYPGGVRRHQPVSAVHARQPERAAAASQHMPPRHVGAMPAAGAAQSPSMLHATPAANGMGVRVAEAEADGDTDRECDGEREAAGDTDGFNGGGV